MAGRQLVVLGAVLALVRLWSATVVGLVLGSAGALIASVSFELAEEGLWIGRRMLSRAGWRSAG